MFCDFSMRRLVASGPALLVAGALATGLPDSALAQAEPAAQMPFSIGGMVSAAEPIVKVVMIILVLLSLATWAVLFAKERALRQRRATADAALAELALAPRLADLGTLPSPVLAQMAQVVHHEIRHGATALAAGRSEGIATRAELKLRVIEDTEMRALAHGLGVLANVGANAPFIGLLGTVWGIMHAFIGIAQTKSTSLAVVAPGIAEALFTTALGLAAAIPATIMYNALGRRMAGYRGKMNAAVAAFLCLISVEADTIALARQPTTGA